MTGWLEFTVDGRPTPQGSKRAYVRNGRANLVEVAGAALKDWRKQVEAAAREAIARDEWWTIDNDPLEVHILFYLPRPKSKPETIWHAVRPDVDKLTRAVLDALTSAQVWRDDCLVSDLRTWKQYAVDNGAPGAVIAVRRIP